MPILLFMMTAPHSPHSSSLPPYFKGLNDVQLEAAQALEGPVLVLAGAGTGKTRVLTTRLAHLIQTGRAFPSQILAVTFTNKASTEMKERVSRLLGGAPVEGWALGTFHALAARMLRKHAELVGLTSSFTILDPDDTMRLIKQIMEARHIDPKKNPPKMVMSMIDRWKDRALSPSDITPREAGDVAHGQMQGIYTDYQARLRGVNACDFGDLLLHVIHILRHPDHAQILADYHRRFKYIMVDEYQDTNVAQYLWLRLLAQGSNNICCVGDDDQSIYGWRGAEVGNILKFEQDFPNARIIRLEQNYRSTGHILGAAGGVIANNQGRLGKTLWCDDEDGEKVRVQGLWDGEAEARFIGEDIESLQHKKVRLKQIAVLVRAGFQMREFEERFIQMGIPYRVFGGPRFYERQEIRDALAYFRVVVQPADDLAFERIVNVPKRGIGGATLKSIHEEARRKNQPMTNATQDMLAAGVLKAKVGAALGMLMGDFDRWRSMLSTSAHGELAGQILDESGYLTMWQSDKSPEAQGRVENLKELIAGMEEFESLPAFLEHVALVMETQNSGTGQVDYVSLMTLHGAKGLEFDCVYLPGWEDGLFPSQKTMDENGLKGLEEERRLAYVGITRARKRATISFAANRRMYGNWVNGLPSRFIDELPEDHVEAVSDSGLYKPGRSQHWDSSGIEPKKLESSHHRETYVPSVTPSPPVVPSSFAKPSVAGFQMGDRIKHATFGEGRVIHVAGAKLDIRFADGSTKRLMDSFVQKAD
ncbi:MAG TPA: UvrD-helicase domain-containing protein [Alphaproteobacteria bacterium]|nr:UvrD-helicase domain-containing protein [Alphaproteobacteria bacterium]